MKIRYNVISDIGKVRTNNEDMALVFEEQIRDSSASFTFDKPEDIRFAAIVADGMGGYDGSEIASEMATKSFNDYLNELPKDLDKNELIVSVKHWVKNINDEIIIAANGSGMGTTVSGIFTYEDFAFTINIGDSRVYRHRYDHFKQLTEDHSERNRSNDPNTPSNIIYNALGIPTAFADVKSTQLVSGDKFLICSDGLSDMVDDDTICNILCTDGDTARDLLNVAINNGGCDNITIIVIEIM